MFGVTMQICLLTKHIALLTSAIAMHCLLAANAKLCPNGSKTVTIPGFSRCSHQFACPFLGLSCLDFHFNQPVHDSQAVSDIGVPWQCNTTAATPHHKIRQMFAIPLNAINGKLQTRQQVDCQIVSTMLGLAYFVCRCSLEAAASAADSERARLTA